MTKLILDPGALDIELPDASVSNSYRIRILGQIIEYIDNESIIIIRRIPNLPCKNNENLLGIIKLNVTNAMPINGDLTHKGMLINAEGFYDGSTIDIFHCYGLNGSDIIPDENINILRQVNELKGFE
ncbi:uncharacterized protein RJT21DRAFT_5097 [Scheffersomyces amazonensis]|uniref:uncharacterized protein n=1 Tax=Scheffersomyces amazonensis TaxID=1078765 RepID=UPI00315C893D